MKNFTREDLSFSLCGLNCVLCTMKIDGYCPGCGGGVGNQGCCIARCSIQRGGYEYCSECREYPCAEYDGITRFDSFITHRNQISDMVKLKELGIHAYRSELERKSQILRWLLDKYNDGRKKTFFCLAVNVLDLRDIDCAVQLIEEQTTDGMELNERAAVAVRHLEDMAKQRDIILKMNRKPSK